MMDVEGWMKEKGYVAVVFFKSYYILAIEDESEESCEGLHNNISNLIDNGDSITNMVASQKVLNYLGIKLS